MSKISEEPTADTSVVVVLDRSRDQAALSALVEDADLCRELEVDPELRELAELTSFADELRRTLAPSGLKSEPSFHERARRVQSTVLRRVGALPLEAALLDDQAQDDLIESKLRAYRRQSEHRLASLLAAHVRRQRHGP